jgi:hypothetical protein
VVDYEGANLPPLRRRNAKRIMKERKPQGLLPIVSGSRRKR